MNRTLFRTPITIRPENSALARITCQQGNWSNDYPASSFPCGFLCHGSFICKTGSSGLDCWMVYLPFTLYYSYLGVNLYSLVAPYIYLLREIIVLVELILELTRCLAQQAERGRHPRSAPWPAVGLREVAIGWDQTKSGIMAVWLPAFHSSVQGVTSGTTEFLLREGERSQTCWAAWKQTAHF